MSGAFVKPKLASSPRGTFGSSYQKNCKFTMPSAPTVSTEELLAAYLAE